MFPIEYYLVVPSNNRPLGKQNNLLLYECIYTGIVQLVSFCFSGQSLGQPQLEETSSTI